MPLSGSERRAYVETATAVALAGVRDALHERRLGTLDGWRNREDDQGSWLELRLHSARHEDAPVTYARLLLPAGDAYPDKDAEVAGVIFGAAFEERLQTRVPRRSVDGTLVL